jgi:nitrite reductase/ring-hydroxylating ferredoxin subunit
MAADLRHRCRAQKLRANKVALMELHRGRNSMAEVFVSKVAELADGERRIVQHGAHEIGVFNWQGQFYAYSNVCLHQGGPACEGLIMHKVEDVIAPDKTWVGQKFSDDVVHFVCPWHGYEFNMKTGECAADKRLRLKSYKVVRRGDDVYVAI